MLHRLKVALSWAAYGLLIYLLLPLVWLYLLWAARGGSDDRRRRAELLGLATAHAQSSRAPIWVHAVSVGEVNAARPVLRALKERYPGVPLVLTTTTRTGAEAARLGDLAQHYYAPLDYPFAIRRFLDRVRPRAVLIMETELWPNLLASCERRDIPVLILNARLSARSQRSYRRFRSFFNSFAGKSRRILCQHQADAERFLALGVPPEKMGVTGSIKFDIAFPPEVYEAGARLRTQLGEQRPVWVAASTHEGEDEKVLAAFSRILAARPEALLILVPRHPERFSRVHALCVERGFSVSRRSHLEVVKPDTRIYLADTMGELPALFAAADIAFIGGSLVEVGGHNPLEAVVMGTPPLTGPVYFNFADIVSQLAEQGGALVVPDEVALANEVLALLSDPARRQTMMEMGQKVVAQNRGALARTVEAIQAEVAPE